MPTNKNQFLRYRLLNECLSNTMESYSMEDLIDYLEEGSCNEGKDLHVSRRTIYEDFTTLKSVFGVEIERYKSRGKTCYRYEDPDFYIPWTKEEDEKVKELRRNFNKLQNFVTKLEKFEGVPMFDWISEFRLRLNNNSMAPIVVFESGNIDVDKLKFLDKLYQAILNRKTLVIRGRSFEIQGDYKKIVSPYMLKQYNCRWYLICKVHNSDKDPDSKHTKLECLPLDRIADVCDANVKYQEYDGNVNEYYEDVIGVTVYKDAEPELIKLKVADATLPYILTRPLHGSQRQDKDNPNIVIFDLIVNYELKSKIRSYGSTVEVIEPQWLRDEFKKECMLMLNNYQNFNNDMSEDEKK